MNNTWCQHRVFGRLRLGAVLLLCGWLAGCASGQLALFGGQRSTPPFRDPNLSVQAASGSLAPGQSTKADVLAALGPATVLKFDSGYEVWAYRTKSAEPASTHAELVILFAPSGVVAKSRVRPAYVVSAP